MTTSPDKPKQTVVVNQSDPNRGRFNPARFDNPIHDSNDPYPEISPEDITATKAELAELRRRMTRRSA